jgi:hypothetical protein
MKRKFRTNGTPLFGEITEEYNPPPKDKVDEIFRHYRQKGFPYLQLTKKEKYEEFKSLVDLDKTLITEDVIISDSTGVKLANSYHNHRYEVVCNNHRTAMKVFKSDISLRKVIEKCIFMQDGFSESKLRSMLAIFEGVQVASNFPPGTAKAIYETYSGNERAIVYDMSCGWGGRLLAALASDNVVEYHGTDPSKQTFLGLNKMAEEIHSIDPISSHSCKPFLYNQGSEFTITKLIGKVDLCFTSPPYYNCEKYAREETQSFLAYPTQTDWLNYFLRPTIENCFKYLRNGKLCIINIANVKTFNDLESCTIKIALASGFELVDTKKLALASMPGQGNGKRKKNKEESYVKFEPVFLFRKP